MTAKLSVSGVSKIYDGTGLACADIGFEIREGEFLCVVGPSGCGKTTLLRMIARLLMPSSGSVEWHDTDPLRPFLSVVSQDLALLPWKTVLDNISLGLKYRGVPKAQREAAAMESVRRLRLEGFARHYPHQLSGGMKQRVALARAFLSDPEVLVMDEPFGSLDAATRLLMQEELLALWEERKKTVVLVTHSLEEAVLLADRIVILTARPGRVKSVLPVDLPRPRRLDVRQSRAFAETVALLWEGLEAELRGRS